MVTTKESVKVTLDLGVHMNYTIRTMEESDYDEVYELWTTIHGFAMRSLDDSKEGVVRVLKRNPGLSVVAVSGGKIVGSILVGHDGRRACFYHVCVHEDYRKHGIGKAMASEAMMRLKVEGINKIQLVAFKENALGNGFWQAEQWIMRDDLNVYDFVLNEANITAFNK
ncbi:GNAT family N-acetyltransferase [Pseudobutyrivibrio ruminis]|uniref:GNAT family N-acetyltransferase n=1 Tax=Pseudobutyrivibrio ruminis TaxID=46206 RepID=UPI0004232910|nr:GNAT family N-acetyltransferase [Pseudobutyrivibrio ruminis]